MHLTAKVQFIHCDSAMIVTTRFPVGVCLVLLKISKLFCWLLYSLQTISPSHTQRRSLFLWSLHDISSALMHMLHSKEGAGQLKWKLRYTVTMDANSMMFWKLITSLSDPVNTTLSVHPVLSLWLKETNYSHLSSLLLMIHLSVGWVCESEK